YSRRYIVVCSSHSSMLLLVYDTLKGWLRTRLRVEDVLLLVLCELSIPVLGYDGYVEAVAAGRIPFHSRVYCSYYYGDGLLNIHRIFPFRFQHSVCDGRSGACGDEFFLHHASKRVQHENVTAGIVHSSDERLNPHRIVSGLKKYVRYESRGRVDRDWSRQVEPVKGRVRPKHLDDGLCVSHYSSYCHCYVLVDPVHFLSVFVRHERAHRCPSVCRQHDSVMADDVDRSGSLKDGQFSSSLKFQLDVPPYHVILKTAFRENGKSEMRPVPHHLKTFGESVASYLWLSDPIIARFVGPFDAGFLAGALLFRAGCAGAS